MLRAFLKDISPKISELDFSTFKYQSGAVLNLNMYALGLLVRDPEFRAVMQRAQVIHLDGFGASVIVYLAIGRWYSASGYRTWGMQIFKAFEGRPFLLLGGTDAESSEAKRRILSLFPEINIEAVNGYNSYEHSLKMISEFEDGVIVIGQGMPRQEVLIGRALDANAGKLYFACGGWIKQIAGFEEDVPRLYKVLKLEWLYRSARRPGHFTERVLNPLICVLKNFY